MVEKWEYGTAAETEYGEILTLRSTANRTSLLQPPILHGGWVDQRNLSLASLSTFFQSMHITHETTLASRSWCVASWTFDSSVLPFLLRHICSWSLYSGYGFVINLNQICSALHGSYHCDWFSFEYCAIGRAHISRASGCSGE